jgi:threonine/homoserine/homoserine lactone efflux protein
VILAALFVAMGLVWLAGYALAASAATGLMRRPAVQRGVPRSPAPP